MTVVNGLHFDLYSAVASAKRGISAVIDFDLTTGENKSFTYCKTTGEASLLIERKQGVLELPIHLAFSRADTTGLIISNESPHPPQTPACNFLLTMTNHLPKVLVSSSLVFCALATSPLFGARSILLTSLFSNVMITPRNYAYSLSMWSSPLATKSVIS